MNLLEHCFSKMRDTVSADHLTRRRRRRDVYTKPYCFVKKLRHVNINKLKITCSSDPRICVQHNTLVHTTIYDDFLVLRTCLFHKIRVIITNPDRSVMTLSRFFGLLLYIYYLKMTTSFLDINEINIHFFLIYLFLL